MERYNRFLYGLIPGLILPVLFIWLYISRLYPEYNGFLDTLHTLYPGILLGKLCMLSILPDLILVFVFYKQDNFKIAAGLLIGGIPYLLLSILML